MDLILSSKYKDFLKNRSPVEFLEGTTFAGKTTVGIFKFMLMVAESRQKLHIISGLDTGTIEKNIINKDLGIKDIFGDLVEYNPAGKAETSLPHLLFHTSGGEKTIYILGYDNKSRWKKALGGQYGCVYIDEINVADMEYVREASMRCDYLMATLNPDSPDLPVYRQYINCSRPLPKYADDAPQELLNMLNEPPKPGWVWWFFCFEHNAALTEEKKRQIITNVPKGTKQYKNKIQGLRGRATGLVFSNFVRERHVVSPDEAGMLVRTRKNTKQTEWFVKYSAGLDTAYSTKSADTIAMAYIGITNKGRCVVLDERVYNNASLQTPIAPSDTAQRFSAFLQRNTDTWGGCRDVFIDSADQATITELAKYKRHNGSVYNFNSAWKKMKIIDRINTQLGWFAHDDFLVCDTCKTYISELDSYSWKEEKDLEPEDGHDHMINAVQYAWIPYKTMIGVKS